MYQSIPKPPIPPPSGHLTHVKLRTVGNLTQNEARPVGHLTFVSKHLSCMSAVGSKRISQFFDSAGERRSRVIPLVDSMWVFLLLSFLRSRGTRERILILFRGQKPRFFGLQIGRPSKFLQGLWASFWCRLDRKRG